MTYQENSSESYRRCEARTQREAIMRALMERGPLTHLEIQRATGISYKSITSRIADMQSDGTVHAGEVVDDGKYKHTRWVLGPARQRCRRFGMVMGPEDWAIIVDSLQGSGSLRAVDIAEKIESKLEVQRSEEE